MKAALEPAQSQRAPTGARHRYTCAVYDSIEDVDEREWRQASGGRTTLFMDRRFIAAVERSLLAGAWLRHVLFRDERGAPVACASLCVYPVDLTLLAHPSVKVMAEWLRRLIPSCGRAQVLFCGLPVSIGQSSLAFGEGCDAAAVVDLLGDLMDAIAKRECVRVKVVKEFTPDECAATDRLIGRGYRRAEAPCMNVFDRFRFGTFDDYRAALTAHYRYDIKRSLRKFAAAGLECSRVRTGEAVARAYTDEVHRLYEAVVLRAKSKLELLPAAFFRALAAAFPDAVSLTLIKDGARVVAFNYALTLNGCYYFLFCGMDYRIRAPSDLYFNLMYRDLDHGLREEVAIIQMGQASEQFKARLGCRTVPLFFYLEAEGALGALLRSCGRLLFPPRPLPPRFDIFKQG